MKPRLAIVPAAEPSPAEKVRQRVKKAPKPADVIQCPRCGGRELIATLSGVSLRLGRPSGGTKVLVCAACMCKGDRVVLA